MKPLVLAELAQNSQASSLWSWSLPRYLAENEIKDKKRPRSLWLQELPGFAEEVAEQELARLCRPFSCAWRIPEWQSLFVLVHPQSRCSIRWEAVIKHLLSSITLCGQVLQHWPGGSISLVCPVQALPVSAEFPSTWAVAWGHVWSPAACLTSGRKSVGAMVPVPAMMHLGPVSVSWCLLISG